MNVYGYVCVFLCRMVVQANWLWSENIRFVYHLTKADFMIVVYCLLLSFNDTPFKTICMANLSLCVFILWSSAKDSDKMNWNRGSNRRPIDIDTVSQYNRRDSMHCFNAWFVKCFNDYESNQIFLFAQNMNEPLAIFFLF